MSRRGKNKPELTLSPHQKLVISTAELIVETACNYGVQLITGDKAPDPKEIEKNVQKMVEAGAAGIESIAGRSQIEALEYLLKLDMCADSTLKIHGEIGRLKRQFNVTATSTRKADGTPRAVVL